MTKPSLTPYNPSPLLQSLRAMPMNDSLTVPDKGIKAVREACRSARNGNDKFFSCKTISGGVVVRRVE